MLGSRIEARGRLELSSKALITRVFLVPNVLNHEIHYYSLIIMASIPRFPLIELLPELQTLVLISAPPCSRTCLALTCKRYWNDSMRPYISIHSFSRVVCEDGSPQLADYFYDFLPFSSEDLASAARNGNHSFILHIIKLFRKKSFTLSTVKQNELLAEFLTDSIDAAASVKKEAVLRVLRQELALSYDTKMERIGFFSTCTVEELQARPPTSDEVLTDVVLDLACANQTVNFLEHLAAYYFDHGHNMFLSTRHLHLGAQNVSHPETVPTLPISQR